MTLPPKSIQALSSIYKTKHLDLKGDLPYLTQAFEGIHKLWDSNFMQIERVKLVMLGEAPLWSDENKYIYNAETPNSQFFHRLDLEPTLGYEPKNKLQFLEALRELGILIADVSPFALNNRDTQLSYGDMSSKMYRQLVDGCWEEHLQPVINQIKHHNPIYVFRYRRVQIIFGEMLEQKLGAKIDSIHQQGGGIDKRKLKMIYEKRKFHAA